MRGKSFLFLLVFSCMFVSACSHQTSFTRRGRSYPTGLDDSASTFLKKKGRGPLPTYDVPIVINEKVKWWIHHFREDLHGRFALYLTRSGRYEHFMRSILAEEGLPQDLIYIALIESGFSNHAHSRAKAVGPWQFIRSTGKIFGLRINPLMDERKDPEKATRAAAQYFKKLYNEFGDWYLAMAAYNAGEGKVRRAVAGARSQDFWDIAAPGTSYLRRETQNYVPKFIAAALIAKNPERFGFHHIDYQEPLAFDNVSCKGPVDLEVASELIASSMEELQDLNPELKMGMIPAEHYLLRIPTGTKEKFESAFAQLPKEQRVRIVYHTVRKGESINKIARRYKISVDSLVAINNLSEKKPHARPGTRLIITKRSSLSSRSSGILLAYNERGKKKGKVNGVEWLIKKDMGDGNTEEVKREDQEQESVTDAPVGDEKGMGKTGLPAVEEVDLENPDLEKKTEVGVSEDQMEKLSKETETKPNAIAAAHEIERKVHVVRRGDNLWKIAKRYQVPMNDLKRWNKLNNVSQLKPGKKILVANP